MGKGLEETIKMKAVVLAAPAALSFLVCSDSKVKHSTVDATTPQSLKAGPAAC